MYTLKNMRDMKKGCELMTANDKGTHLSFEDRKIIETGISNGSTKTAIAKIIGKDNSTVGKEIDAHRILKSKCPRACERKSVKMKRAEAFCGRIKKHRRLLQWRTRRKSTTNRVQ